MSSADTLARTPRQEEFADIKSVVITQENEEKVGFHIDYSTHLTDEERRLYRSAVLRASMEAVKNNDTTMPLVGKTVGQVIEEERSYQARHGETGTQLLDRMEDGRRKTQTSDTMHDKGTRMPVFPDPGGWKLREYRQCRCRKKAVGRCSSRRPLRF